MMNTRAEKVITFIHEYIKVPEGPLLGQPLVLDEFQEKFIREVYDNRHGTRNAILSMARKNGKTGLIAALLIVHLAGPEAIKNSQIVSGAMSREQASLVFGLAVKMINQSPELEEVIRIVPSGKRLIGLARNTEFKALAADGKTAHGLSPVLAILDELGQVSGPQSDFIDAITTSQGAYESPLLITISTQAPTDGDLLSIWIDDALQNKDPHTVCHVYAADKDADVMDRDAWAAANPALGTFRHMNDMKELAGKAQRMPSFESTFRNLNLNQRVNTVDPFVSKDVWKSCGGHVKPVVKNKVWAGLDLSSTKDLTALVLVWEDEGGIWQAESHFWAPQKGVTDRSKHDRVPYDVWAKEGWITLTPGVTVDYDWIVTQLPSILGDCDLQALAFDRWNIGLFKKSLERQGVEIPLVEFGQGYASMSPALDALEDLLLNKKIVHGDNPVLTMCAANAVVAQDSSGNRKLEKSKRIGRIDGMVALTMAIGSAKQSSPNNKESKPSIYETQGILFI